MGEIFNFNEIVVNWPQVFTAKTSRMYPNNPAKYSVACRIVPNSPDHQNLVNAINKVVAEHFPNGNYQLPKMDVDPTTGMIEVRASASADSPPGVIDGNKEEILNPGDIYSGAICNVAVDVYASTTYNRVCIGLLALQKVKDSDRLDNRPDAKELFKPITTINTLATPRQPAVPTVNSDFLK